jgi:ABC-type Fe3+/spermidine/putrescine transport system ATPase subunit
MELQIRNLSKTYANGVHALKNVSLTLPRGMFGLLGPNGAGKSTLMRTIATLQEPDQGSIRFGDIDVLRQKDRVRETLGYLPQEFGVFANVTAERLLDHFAVLKGNAPGSWLWSARGIRVIDPELCFVGAREFDSGVMLAHLALARVHRQAAALIVAAAGREQLGYRAGAWLCGAEIMRRLIGAVPLAARYRVVTKRHLLDLSRSLMLAPERGLTSTPSRPDPQGPFSDTASCSSDAVGPTSVEGHGVVMASRIRRVVGRGDLRHALTSRDLRDFLARQLHGVRVSGPATNVQHDRIVRREPRALDHRRMSMIGGDVADGVARARGGRGWRIIIAAPGDRDSHAAQECKNRLQRIGPALRALGVERLILGAAVSHRVLPVSSSNARPLPM